MAKQDYQTQKERNKRHSILQSAMHVFGEQGFEATKMEHIAKQANIGKGTLYLYFSSKDELVREMLKAAITRHAEYLKTEMERRKDPIQKLRAMYMSHLQLLQKDGHLSRLSLSEMSFVNTEIRQLILHLQKDLEQFVRDIYKEGVRQNIFQSLDENVVSKMLISNLKTVHTVQDSLNEDQIEVLLEVLMNGLKSRKGEV